MITPNSPAEGVLVRPEAGLTGDEPWSLRVTALAVANYGAPLVKVLRPRRQW